MKKYELTLQQKQHQTNCNNVRKTDLINRIALRLEMLVEKSGDIENNEADIYINEYKEQLTEKSHNDNLRYYVGYMIEQGNKEAVKIMKMIIEYNLLCNVVVE